ncbi:DUF664 domain-containing protein [Mycobacterium sp. CBMA247]|nr:DUF664 domain-containing protein [Mycolicibacterium sp. CBMA 329]MUL91567.1 DUF664 domain-containing protein [Mycolicibacterium sp. CBMA 331]MUM02193.1 DUF664 domain-containing protein [Mycolicibacterium sp. CBMA 334]MUM28024.1 DUF664 domain-containing protein [Mycolicibacterium sp. CBMA 295]MUM41143.1 DUF664 domain-containing protein [Mycolicibacterium sp. CBMA 247]MUM47522.1 DUF664 domain-containing protein [Mycolicibacterium sp. CBMA 294]
MATIPGSESYCHPVGTVNLRFIYLGMIGETARHAGHADILVEQIRAQGT